MQNGECKMEGTLKLPSVIIRAILIFRSQARRRSGLESRLSADQEVEGKAVSRAPDRLKA
jgi:hypothetical protein